MASGGLGVSDEDEDRHASYSKIGHYPPVELPSPRSPGTRIASIRIRVLYSFACRMVDREAERHSRCPQPAVKNRDPRCGSLDSVAWIS